ncbi:MAG TPA: cell division protein ZapA [Spirochaetia bacterium]|nr:cell division protein ZapA [Spirochaetia bacterium]
MRIELLGTSFTLQSDEDPEYLADLLDFYRTKIEEISRSVSTRDSLKLAILSALLVTDELFKERRHSQETAASTGEELGRITEELIAKIDAAMPDPK